MQKLSISKLFVTQFLFSLFCISQINAMGLKDGIQGDMKMRAESERERKMEANLQNGMGGRPSEYPQDIPVFTPLIGSTQQSHLDKIFALTLQQQLNAYEESQPDHCTSDNNHVKPAQAIHLDITSELADVAVKSAHPTVALAIHRLKTLPFEDDTRPRGMLLVGPAGCGKTTLAAAIAKHCNAPIFSFRSTQIGNEWQNSANLNLVKIFKEAREINQFCIVAIDELQTFFKKTKNPHDPESEMLQTLWGQLDDCQNSKVFFIGMLNPIAMPDTISTRFGSWIINISFPDTKQREKLLEFCEQQQKHKASLSEEVSPKKLAAITEGFNCRDLTKAFNESCQLAKEENELGKKTVQTKAIVKMSHFKEAVEKRRRAEKVAKNEPGIFEKMGNYALAATPRLAEGVILKVISNLIDGASNEIYNKRHNIDPGQQQRQQQEIFACQKQRLKAEAEQLWNNELRNRSTHAPKYDEQLKYCEMLQVQIKTLPKSPQEKDQNKSGGSCTIQ